MKRNIKPKIKIWEKFSCTEKEWELMPNNFKDILKRGELTAKEKEQIRRFKSVLKVYLDKIDEVKGSFLVS